MSKTARVRRLALTPGEPAGIGPDLCIKIAQRELGLELVAVCDPALLAARAAQLNQPLTLQPFRPAQPPRKNRPGVILVDGAARLSAPVQPGMPARENAGYVIATLSAACDGCLDGRWDALVTAPVHKGIINDAGIPFSGHTEFLAECCAVRTNNGESPAPTPVMMLTAPGLRVALATTHMRLAEVPQAITETRLTTVIEALHSGLIRDFGIREPRILVCGLNPHAGEGGHLGTEETEVIEPVIQRLRARGIDLTGPLAADTLFVPHRLEAADAVLAMYHDQGLPILKHLGFGRAVNVTLGLPITRTSVDHGTALPLAGTGRADPSSLIEAIKLAELMASRSGDTTFPCQAETGP